MNLGHLLSSFNCVFFSTLFVTRKCMCVTVVLATQKDTFEIHFILLDTFTFLKLLTNMV